MNKLKLTLLILLSGLLSNCAPQPPDVPVCQHLGQKLSIDPVTTHIILTPSPTCVEKINEPECGHCTRIVSGIEFYVGEKKLFNGKPWSQLKMESVYVPSEESYAPLAAYMINACKKMHCQDEVTRFRIKLDPIARHK